MYPFRRQPEPHFWNTRESEWLGKPFAERSKDPLALNYEGRELRAWFHELVRAPNEPRLCAYCDGALDEQSRSTIDHFLPKQEFPEYALSWDNLFPACDQCNETEKGKRWSCRLVKPDRDPVEQLFDLDEVTGRLLPGAKLNRWMKANVLLTIHVLGLNSTTRCNGRKRVIQEMRNAYKAPPDEMTLEQRATQGPYRFVAMKALAALRAI